MEQNHEMAYNLLDSLDQVDMTRRQFARYCLLKSIALDKMYIDLTTDSLIIPAVKYYVHHGSYDEKLKTAFYHARIMENRQEKDSSLNVLLNAEKYADKTTDHLFVGRYYVKISQLYQNRFEFEKALKAVLCAERHSQEVDDFRGLATALLTASSLYYVLHQKDKAEDYLKRILPIWSNINDYRKGEYYRLLLTYALEDNSPKVDSIYNQCIQSKIQPQNLPYIAFADYFISKRDTENAIENLNLSATYGKTTVDSKEYLYRLYKIEDLKGNYQQALDIIRQYYSKLEEHEYESLTSNVKVLEKEIGFAQNRIRTKIKTSITISIFIIAMMIMVYVIFLLKQKREKLELALSDAKKEKMVLEELAASSSLVSEEMLDIISKRINLLNTILLKTMEGKSVLSKGPKDMLDSLLKNSFLHPLYSISFPC